MVGSMPYSFEKGPYLSIMENQANSSIAKLRELLVYLREGRSIAELGGFDSTTIAGGPLDLQGLIKHTNDDWFGWGQQPLTGKWTEQPAFDPVTNPTTGFWQDWYGDCEGVLRRTLIRGFEVALGMGQGDPVGTGNGGQRWHIEAFWRCPIPWFEGWVTWRKHGTGSRDGQVMIMVSSPGHGTPLKNTPLRENGGPGYALEPQGPPADRGMNVISQKYHRPWPKLTTESSGLGEWTFPTTALAYESQGDVVCVSPPEAEGGILDLGRAWTPEPRRRRKPPMSPSYAQPNP